MVLCERLTWDLNLKPPIRALDVVFDVFHSRVATSISEGCSFGSIDGIESETE
jgi:hypothetical protein